MVQRYLLASLAVVLTVAAIVLIDGLIAELTGLSVPGELSAALAFFVAFLVGGRIGGSRYFWFGILLFLAINVWSANVVFDAVRDIQAAGGNASDATWVSVVVESWFSSVLSLVASIMGLKLGARGSPKLERSDGFGTE